MPNNMYLNPENAVVQDPNDKRFYSKRERQLNIDLFLQALNNTDLDFESSLYTAADFFQSVFLNALVDYSSSDEEVNQSLARVTRMANKVLDVFEDSQNSGAEDFAALMTVILDLTDYMLRSKAEDKNPRV